MSTLESQYKKWSDENPDNSISFIEWLKEWGKIHKVEDINTKYPYVSDNFQIGPEGAFEYSESQD